jgi:hypothetical protein
VATPQITFSGFALHPFPEYQYQKRCIRKQCTSFYETFSYFAITKVIHIFANVVFNNLKCYTSIAGNPPCNATEGRLDKQVL